ncbi:Co2+/Mg2+ efflux protein ApaG [Shewanella sp. D64]|uniref:Co2+/Mg2+ efflux protein ApaG n=1 Tax=unclassified Shewanella TaxID=196818 RepID=UPI0022BA2CC9|nr:MULTISPECIES: Co2+/Mg2+ efflux protein ApaG [unclassified Shewanella]MEC4727270.1 Co2+/Mg2+ efflux protein ApaG [Shewanella sp. D64]MEC4739425.1 Co2+/Mg2+ efflux protein ApaG [Shewanella sp. E94]WBJ96754.1 Co2+/Mg2+ efflux protein ApaG [Shewanella sp. MTB7]
MTELEASIKIEVKTEYIEEQSSPNDERYLFRYTITIINLGKEPVTLKTRHWSITDSNQHFSVVQGAGVVGETPTIAPDTAYQYTSGTVLETPLGVMQGSYGMLTESGEVFNATILPFRLSVPGLLH